MLYYNQKEKRRENSKMLAIDLTNMTYHAEVDRATRFSIINKTVGFGNPVYIASDKKGRDATATLTDTGVLIVRDLTNKIITAYVASVKQAMDVYKRATGNDKMPRKLWATINYNNNTEAWKKMIAVA